MSWALAIALAANVLLAEPAPQIGKDAYGKETLESLETLGTVKLNGTTISKSIKVTGNLIAHSATLRDVDATGDVQFFDTTVEQKMQATGSLKATGSKFLQPLTFSGQRCVFSACQLNGITIHRDRGFKGAQIIELREKTQINGPIHFAGGGGRVILYPGSKVQGTVTGATISHKH